MRSQSIGSCLIVEKDEVVYINNVVVNVRYNDAVKLIDRVYQEGFTEGYDIGKIAGRKNP